MAKKKKSEPIAFSTWETKDYLIEAVNVARWNPRLAIQWMKYAKIRLTSTAMEDLYQRSAVKINQFLDSLELMDYYRKFDYWENDKVQRVELLNVPIPVIHNEALKKVF